MAKLKKQALLACERWLLNITNTHVCVRACGAVAFGRKYTAHIEDPAAEHGY